MYVSVCVLFIIAVLLVLFCGDVSWGCVLFSFSLFFSSYVCPHAVQSVSKGSSSPVE